MTLMVHKLIDALKGVDPKVTFTYKQETRTIPDSNNFAKVLTVVNKFDFINIPWEPRTVEGTGDNGLRIPNLTEDEWLWWKEGLLPLPYPCVWYEFDVTKETRCGLLIEESKEDGTVYWYITKILRHSKEKHRMGPEDYMFRHRGFYMRAHRSVLIEERKRIEPLGCEYAFKAFFDHYKNGTYDILFGDLVSAIYLTMMLNSKSTTVTTDIAEAKLSRSRIKKGRSPLFTHSVVDIVSRRFRSGGSEGTHASPRLHERRSHKRHLKQQTGRAVWVPTEKHQGTEGWWITVIPRCFVGRAELGTVTHDYRVL